MYLADVRLEQETLTLVLKSSQTSAACPSARTHLPASEAATHARWLICHVRDERCACAWRCAVSMHTRGCPRTTFAERFPQLSRAYARRTLRQAEALTEIAFAQEAKRVRSWRSASRCRPVGRPPAAHAQLGCSPTQDPAGAGTGRFRLEKRRPLRHAAGRSRSPLPGEACFLIGKRPPSSAGYVRIGA